MDAMDTFVEERLHQIDLGFNLTHDLACHEPADLMRAAVCYLDLAALQLESGNPDEHKLAWGEQHPFWPSESSLPWRPEETFYANAAKGAAFAAAALDLQNHIESL